MEKDTTLVFAHTCFYFPGGAERQIVWLAQELAARGIKLRILASDFGEWAIKAFSQKDIEFKTLELNSVSLKLAGYQIKFDGIKPFIQQVPRRTLLQSPQQNILKNMGRKLSDHAKDAKVIVSFGFPSYLWNFFAGQNVILPASGWFCFEPPGMLYRDKIFPHFHKEKINPPAAIVAVEQAAAEFPRLAMTTSSHIKGICEQIYKRKDFIPLYAGLPVPVIESRPSPYNFSFIFSASRLYPEKNYSNLIKGFARLDTKVKLLIGGDGPEKVNLEKLINELNLTEKVILLGQLTDAQLIQHYQHCMMVVFPGLDEPLGLIPIESGFHRKACLVSSQGGPKETVKDGETGRWFNPLDPADIAKIIQEVLDFPQNLRSMGEKAYEYTMSNFTISAFADRFLAVIDKLI